MGRPARGAVHAAARYTAPQAPLNRARARGRSPTSARGRPTDRGRRTSRFYSPTSPRHVAAENYETGPAGPTRLRPTASAAADAVCASRDQCAVGCGVVASCAARSHPGALPPSVPSVDARGNVCTLWRAQNGLLLLLRRRYTMRYRTFPYGHVHEQCVARQASQAAAPGAPILFMWKQ